MANHKTVTLRHLAEKLGLTVQTVSKALRGLPGMSEETRQAVAALARKSGYRTKEQFHSLAIEQIPLFSSKPRRFKFMITSDFSLSSLNQLILQGLQEKLSEFGHTIETMIVSDSITDNAHFLQWAEQQNLLYTDGIFISPSITPTLEKHLLALRIPRILVNFPPDAADVDSVIWDVATAIHQSVAQLRAMGHTRILYVGDTLTHRGFRIRWQAFQKAMLGAGLEVTAEQHVIGKLIEKEPWIDELSYKLKALDATAILSALDYDLAWIYYACSSAGKSIPDDCSLISLQNTANAFMPKLSRPLLLVKEAGQRAAERMLWRLANPTLPYEQIRLQGTFFAGETVRAL